MKTGRRVVVVTSDVPFVAGGHRVIAEELTKALKRSGHAAELVRTPQNPFGRQFSAYMANWFTDVSETGESEPVDQLISLRYPSFAVRHRRHICWLNHRMREYYDLWPALKRRISKKGVVKESVRRFLIHQADHFLLTTAWTTRSDEPAMSARLMRGTTVATPVAVKSSVPRMSSREKCIAVFLPSRACKLLKHIYL